MIKETKVIIIGGGLSGLVAANLLSHLGINSIILEQNTKIGGWNSSFKDELGNIFDYGYHALDFNRSVITTKFFQKILQNNYLKFELKRGIVLKNYLFPYNSPLLSWPKELRKLFKRENIIDNIKNDITKKKIAETYGIKFAHFIFNEVLTSYPSQYWAIRNGSREEDVLGIVYPWFFPKIKKEIRKNSEWESYHDMVRKKSHQYVLYPKKGGFNGFVESIIHDTDTNLCQIITNVKNTQLDINKKSKKVTSVKYNDIAVSPDLVIWCNSPISLLNLLNVKNLNIGSSIPQEIVLGNFVFEKNLKSNYHEILVGSSEHKINRISFPGKISSKTNNLVQTEFSFPSNEFSLSKIQWKIDWLKSLHTLGIVQKDNKLRKFTLYKERRGLVTTKNWISLMSFYKNKFLKFHYENLVIPSFNIGPENINRIIPEVIFNVVNSLRIINRSLL